MEGLLLHFLLQHIFPLLQVIFLLTHEPIHSLAVLLRFWIDLALCLCVHIIAEDIVHFFLFAQLFLLEGELLPLQRLDSPLLLHLVPAALRHQPPALGHLTAHFINLWSETCHLNRLCGDPLAHPDRGLQRR